MQHSESEWGRHLITIRGFQYVMASLGDPYAAVLTDESADPDVPIRALEDGHSTMVSQLGPLVVLSPELVVDTLRTAPLGTAHPVQAAGGVRPVDHVGEQLWETWNTCHVLSVGPSVSLTLDDYRRLHGYVDYVAEATARLLESTAGSTPTALASLPDRFDAVADYVTPITAHLVAAATGAAAETVAEFLAQPVRVFDALLCPPRVRDARAALALDARLRDEVARSQKSPRRNSIPETLTNRGVPREDQLIVVELICAYGATAIHHTVVEALAALASSVSEMATADRIDHALRVTPPTRLLSRVAESDCRIGEHEVRRGEHVVLSVAETSPNFAFDYPLFLSGSTYEPVLRPWITRTAAVIVELLLRERPTVSLTDPDARPHRFSRVPLSLSRNKLFVDAPAI